MSVNALSSHGTLVDVQITPGGAWVEIAEQGDITIPGRSRGEFDSATQNENIDSYVVSDLMRRGPLKINFNFIPGNSTHDHLTGLDVLFNANTMTGWRMRYPDGTAIIASGQIQAIGDISAPVDGKLSADYTIRFSGVYIYDPAGAGPAVTIGA